MLFICICIGYFLGALPFGYLIARAHGICIFTSGSGNPGATNVLRTLGKKAGYTVFILDTGKGLLAAYIGVLLNFPYTTLFSALLGHSYSCFTHFKGGKGIATLIGGLSCLVPIPLCMSLVLWGIVFKLTHYVSLASITFAWILPCFHFLHTGQCTVPLILFACFFPQHTFEQGVHVR